MNPCFRKYTLLGVAAIIVTVVGCGWLGAQSKRTLHPIEKQTVRVFERVSPSVVYITNKVIQRDFFSLNVFEVPKGTGSGFVWDDEGHIVTNYHVIHGASRLSVSLEGSKEAFRAQVVGTEPGKDLAVLKLERAPPGLIPIAKGTSADLKVGQVVLAIGNPFGLDHTLTKGIVSALGREIKAMTGRTIRDVIQTDAAINPGNSGGPLLDFEGRLVGVNTAIFSPSGSSAGIGFAVPVDTIRRIVPQLIQHGKFIRPTMGVTLLPEKFSQRIGVKGLIVREVYRGSSAARAGIQGLALDPYGEIEAGDVIQSINGQEVDSVDGLLYELEKYSVGDEVKVGLLREEGLVEVSLTLESQE